MGRKINRKDRRDNGPDGRDSKRSGGLKKQDHRLDRNATKEAIRSGAYDDLSGRVKTRRANPLDWY